MPLSDDVSPEARRFTGLLSMTTTSIPTVIPEDFITNLSNDPLTTAVNFYAARLPLNDRAVAFTCDELKLTLEQASKERIGFSDRRLGKTLPSNDSAAGREIRKLLKSVGLFKPSGHEALRGCITIPLFDDNGNITGIVGRRIDRSVKADDITIGEGTMRAPIIGNAPPSNVAPVIQASEDSTTKDTKSTKPKSQDNDLTIEPNQITFTRDDRRYRIRGLERNTNPMTLKVNLLASRDDLVHLDTIDLMKSCSRASFIKATATELYVDADTIKRDIGQLLLKLETLRDQQLSETTTKPKPIELTARERDDALALLRSPNLLDRIVSDMDACGMVGESTNKLVGYLAATSRKLKTPLAIVIQSSSSAGKTSLMDAILDMMPPEDINRLSGLTGRSLYYLHSDDIRHKILAICEDQGIREASYALKILQSDGELRQLTTERGNDGRMKAIQYHVEGPTQIMLTSTAMDIEEELVNRCLVLTVDETKHQTDAIQSKQRESFTTNVASNNDRSEQLRRLHQNAQRLLRPLKVHNPYAMQLTFPNHKTRMRRDHLKYLNVINTIALLHQHQREIHTRDGIESIDVERSDIEVANRLAGEILGQSLDELAPQTRRLLGLIHEHVDSESKTQSVSRHAFRFTRRDIRHATQWSDFQVHKHLTRLVDLEYILAHRGKRGSRYVYELLYDGEGSGGTPFLMGLADPATLKEPQSFSP